jgi:RNA polymerase sigma-70 factor (ECF subfamily)
MIDYSAPRGGPNERWLMPERSTALLRVAQSGTAPELDVFLAALRPPLFAFFARRVENVVADDLTQQALLIVAREFRRIRPDDAGRWLVTVARNVVRDEYRRMARAAGRYAPPDDAHTVAAPGSVAALAEYRELARAVVTAAHETCTESLRAVVLGLVRGLDVAEMAREQGVSQQAVRVRLTRARALLRRALRPFDSESPQPRG